MYKHHQEAELLDSYIETKAIGEGEWKVPNLTESVSLAEDGALHITLTNLSVEEDYEIDAVLVGAQVSKVKGEIVTGEMHAKNTFDEPEEVKVEVFDKAELTDSGLKLTIPKCSVVHLEVK